MIGRVYRALEVFTDLVYLNLLCIVADARSVGSVR
jgi:hypothetical protein